MDQHNSNAKEMIINSKASLLQYPAFDSLHWFQSVSEHHDEERARVEERAKGPSAYDVKSLSY